MTHRLLAIGAITILVLGLVLLVVPVSRYPLLDANHVVLSETPREGWCTGQAYGESRGKGDDRAFKDCMAESGLNNDINHDKTQEHFCGGVIDKMGLDMTKSECMDIMEAKEFWPTMRGTLTNSWNRANPYPGGILKTDTGSNSSRTGERDSNERTGGFDR